MAGESMPDLAYLASPAAVPGRGPSNARIVIVGEAPGADEVVAGQPFVGGSGRLLRAFLHEAGINPQQCYFTNVVKFRPQRNDFSLFYLDGEKRRQPSPFLVNSIKELHSEIGQIRPNVIVPLGAEALKAITGHDSIAKWRGSIISTPLGKCVPSYHPAFILRVYESHPILQLDLRRVAAEASDHLVSTPQPRFLLDPTVDEVLAWLRRPRKRLAFDIETTGELIRCLGLADSPDDAICIPFISTKSSSLNHADVPAAAGAGTIISLNSPLFNPGDADVTRVNNHWTEEDEYVILAELDRVFRDPSIEKVAHNFPFDAERLASEFGFQINNFVMDTMVAFHTCYCELPKGLDFLCSVYTRHPYYSDYDTASDRSTWIYNCYDCIVTFESSVRLDGDMADLGVAEYYKAIKHPAITAFLRVEQRGILVDNNLRSEWLQKTRERFEQLAQGIRIYSKGRVENPSSPAQIAAYLYGDLGLAVQYNHKTKSPTVDKNAIPKLTEKYPQHEAFFTLFSEYQQSSTTLRFLEREVSRDGKMRTHYSVAGTLSDRFNSSEPLFGPGTNLQNIPRGKDKKRPDYGFRRMFIADPGHVLLKCDLSQAEFRIVAWLANIRQVIKRYTENPDWDVHRWVASLIYKKPEADIVTEERDIAKNGVYGGNYEMQDKTAARTYKLDLAVARFVLAAYRKAIPEIPQWWQKVQNQLHTNRTIKGPLGASRFFFGRINDTSGETFRKAYAHSASHIVAGIINRAGSLAEDIFPPDECHVVLQVHDELVFQARREVYQSYIPRIKNLLEYPINFPNVPEPLIIPADVNVGLNWFDQMKPQKFLEMEQAAAGEAACQSTT